MVMTGTVLSVTAQVKCTHVPSVGGCSTLSVKMRISVS